MESSIKKIALVFNSRAGAGRAKQLLDNIQQHLQSLGIVNELFADDWPASFNNCSDVWIVGGDGTLNYFVNKYPDIKLPLAIFDGGSGNDFHWMLYGKVSWQEQVEVILNSKPKPVDVGRCNGKIFMNSTGAGFDGVVVKSIEGKNKKKGKASFFSAVIKKIFTYKEHRYLIEGDGIRVDEKFLIVSIMNGKRAGGGFHIAPVADIHDGLLDITLIRELGLLQRLLYLPVVEKGKHSGRWFNQQFQVKNLHIISDTSMDAQLDGEYFTSKRIEIEVLPNHFFFRF